MLAAQFSHLTPVHDIYTTCLTPVHDVYTTHLTPVHNMCVFPVLLPLWWWTLAINPCHQVVRHSGKYMYLCWQHSFRTSLLYMIYIRRASLLYMMYTRRTSLLYTIYMYFQCYFQTGLRGGCLPQSGRGGFENICSSEGRSRIVACHASRAQKIQGERGGARGRGG
jgi:hypothetical protein